MADNIAITEGSGTTIGTDQVGTVHYQQVKLVDGTLNSATAVVLPTSLSSGGGLKVGITDGTVVAQLSAGVESIGTVVAQLSAGTNAFGTVTAKLSAGTSSVGTVVAQLSAGASSIGTVVAQLSAGTNNIGDVDILSLPNEGQQTMANSISVVTSSDQTDIPVKLQPQTTGGLTIFRSLDLDETEEEVKATAGQVFGIWFTNTATTTRWLKFYNATAANVTVGTTTPVITLGLPGNTSDDVSGIVFGANGVSFGTAITVAVTTGVADADVGAPAANDVIINVFYK